MAWYYEITDKDCVLETSEAIYTTPFEAQMAGYKRVKHRLDYLIGDIPGTGWKVEGGLRSTAAIDPTITAK